jgi:ActR/RegA family two-component response regulator
MRAPQQRLHDSLDAVVALACRQHTTPVSALELTEVLEELSRALDAFHAAQARALAACISNAHPYRRLIWEHVARASARQSAEIEQLSQAARATGMVEHTLRAAWASALALRADAECLAGVLRLFTTAT